MVEMSAMGLVKSRMQMKHVFFALLLLETPLIEAKDDWKGWGGHHPTACTDMRSIWYSPTFLVSLHKDIQLFVLAHEIMHIALKHGIRGAKYPDKELVNIAQDFAINIILRDAGFKIWDKCYIDKFNNKPVDFRGMSFEQIYPKLVEMCKKGGGGGLGDQGGMGGDSRAPEGMGAIERAEMERKIDRKVAQSATQARMFGQMGGQLAQVVDGILNPPLTWQELLRNYMTKTTPDAENWGYRNRRFSDVYLPGKHSLSMGEMLGIVSSLK